MPVQQRLGQRVQPPGLIGLARRQQRPAAADGRRPAAGWASRPGPARAGPVRRRPPPRPRPGPVTRSAAVAGAGRRPAAGRLAAGQRRGPCAAGQACRWSAGRPRPGPRSRSRRRPRSPARAWHPGRAPRPVRRSAASRPVAPQAARSASARKNSAPPPSRAPRTASCTRRHGDLARRREQQRRGAGRRQHDPAVTAGQPARAGPDDLAGRGQLVEQRGGVAWHPAGQHQRLQRGGRAPPPRPAARSRHRRRPGQVRRVAPAAAPRPSAAGDCPACCQAGRKAASASGGTGSTSLRSLARQRRRSRRSTPASHHSAPRPPGRNSPSATRPVRGQPVQRAGHDRDAEPVAAAAAARGERAVRAGVPGHQVAERVGAPAR